MFVHPIQSSLTLLYRIYLLQKIALAQAYRGRKLDSIFNESEYIAIAILSIFQSFLIGIPLMFIVHDYPTAYYFTQVAICFIISAATTLLIFVPKIVFMWRGGFEENPERKMTISKTSRILTNSRKSSNKGFRFDDNSSKGFRVVGSGGGSKEFSYDDNGSGKGNIRYQPSNDSSGARLPSEFNVEKGDYRSSSLVAETSNASRVEMNGNVEQTQDEIDPADEETDYDDVGVEMAPDRLVELNDVR